MAVTRNMIRIFTFASTDPSGYYHEFWGQNDRARLHIAGSSGAYCTVDWSHHMRTGGQGPGSGNHWSDQYRSVYGNFMLGSQSSFDRMYGTGAWDSYYTSAYTNQGSSGSGSIPGSTVITDRTNISTIIGWINSGFNVSIVSAFGNTNLIGSFGSLGSYSLGADGAIRFANPTAGMVAGEGVAQGQGGGNPFTLLDAAGGLLALEDGYNNFFHNHKTYTTTKGVTKNIYKANGAVRSARAAKFATTSKFIKGAGVAGTGLMTGVAFINIVDDISKGNAISGKDVLDFSFGAGGLLSLALVANPVSLSVIGGVVAVYSVGSLAYDLYTTDW